MNARLRAVNARPHGNFRLLGMSIRQSHAATRAVGARRLYAVDLRQELRPNVSDWG